MLVAGGVGKSALQVQRLEDVKSRSCCLSPEKRMSSPGDREREEPKSQVSSLETAPFMGCVERTTGLRGTSIASDNPEVAGDFSKRSFHGGGSQPMADRSRDRR